MSNFKTWLKKVWKKIDKDDVLSPVQKLAFEIYELCLNDDNNIIYLNTRESEKRYIVSKKYIFDKDVSTFIIFGPNARGGQSKRLVIVNHEYMYDVDFPEKTSVKMMRMFDDRVEQDREEMEKEILSNITSSLSIVLADFKNKLVETKIEKKPCKPKQKD